MIHLDTSFLVDVIRETRRNVAGPAREWLAANPSEVIAISVPVLCELMVGAALHAKPGEELRRVERICAGLPVAQLDERVPAVFASAGADLIRKGAQVATMDLLIASIALADGAALLTRNERDFERIQGLKVITY